MSTVSNKVNKTAVKSAAKKVEYSPFVESLTRFGYGVRGFIYIIIGVLALKYVLGLGGQLASPQEAIAEIGKQSIGKILLGLVLLGLISYTLWGLIRAVLDPLHKGHDLNGVFARLGFLVSAFGYAVLIPPTYGYIMGNSSSGSSSQGFISSIMSMPWGRWVIGIAGVAGVIGGIYQIYQGIKSHFDRQFQIYALTPDQAKLAVNVARFGTAARGVVFVVLGILIAVAAYNANPNQSIAMDAALSALLKLPFGVWILAIVALGLVAFGVYSLLSAIWFRLKR